MITYHLSRLKDKNPEVRIKSIEELALLEATQAYEALEKLFREDPVPTVRKAAQKAGLVLFKKMQEEDHEDGQSPSS